MGRGSRLKGWRHENAIVKMLLAAGFKAIRSPLSGALRQERYGGGCDIEVDMFGRDDRVECKHHRVGFAKLYRWLIGVDFLIVRADRSEPLVVIPLSRLIEIAKATKTVKRK